MLLDFSTSNNEFCFLTTIGLKSLESRLIGNGYGNGYDDSLDHVSS